MNRFNDMEVGENTFFPGHATECPILSNHLFFLYERFCVVAVQPN